MRLLTTGLRLGRAVYFNAGVYQCINNLPPLSQFTPVRVRVRARVRVRVRARVRVRVRARVRVRVRARARVRVRVSNK